MMKAFMLAILLAVALLATASAIAAPATNACEACAYIKMFDSMDSTARAIVFDKSCQQVVAAQSQGVDAAKFAQLHSACVAVQSVLFDPLMLCTDILQCGTASGSAGAEVADAAVGKPALRSAIKAMAAAAVTIPVIPCGTCENAVPLLKALTATECNDMMVAAVTDVLQKPCGFFCKLAVSFTCSNVLPVAANNPTKLCQNVLKCAPSDTPTPSMYPLDCKKCVGTMTLAINIPADKCPGFMPGVLKANGVPPDPAIINFVCKDALPILAKKSPADTCNKMLKCSNIAPTMAAPTAAPTTAAPTDAPAAPNDAPATPTDMPVAPTDAPVAPTDVPVAPTDAAPSAFPTAPPPPRVAFHAGINVPCDKCIAEGVEHGADADDAALVCQVCSIFCCQCLFACESLLCPPTHFIP